MAMYSLSICSLVLCFAIVLSCAVGAFKFHPLKCRRNGRLLQMEVNPELPMERLKRSLLTSVSSTATVFVASTIVNARGYDPIPRWQGPEEGYNSEAAILPPTGNLPDFKKVRDDIKELIKSKPDKGPTLVRLAWHSSGTYDAMSKTGGSNGGTIRFKQELAHGANAGLDYPIVWLEPIYKKYNKDSDLSYADLYTLAGVVAIEALGGPKVGWRAGRVDTIDESKVTPDGRLPDADKGDGPGDKTRRGLRETFNRMGFNDQEIVALSGAHALGRCHATASGYVGPWSPTPTTFNNAYFTLLQNIKWEVNDKIKEQGGPLQYKDPSGKLMMLPSDIALIQDEGFKKYVDIYAKDSKKFFSDFSVAFQKLEELGCEGLVDVV